MNDRIDEKLPDEVKQDHLERGQPANSGWSVATAHFTKRKEAMIDEHDDKPKHNEDMGLTLSAEEEDRLEEVNQEMAARAAERRRKAKAAKPDAV